MGAAQQELQPREGTLLGGLLPPCKDPYPTGPTTASTALSLDLHLCPQTWGLGTQQVPNNNCWMGG